jgi:hypothetical protein
MIRGEQCLTNGVVNLVCTCVIQVFALENNFCPAKLFAQTLRVIQRRGTADVVLHIMVEGLPE